MIVTSTKLTQSQMMIWMGQKISPSNPLYNMIFTFEISGKIDVTCFKKAFEKLVEQNDILRSTLVVDEGVPKQVFHHEIDNAFDFFDFSNSIDGNQEYSKWVECHKIKVFETDEPLYQAALFKIHDGKFILYFNQHHLIADAWSTQNCYDELNQHYLWILNASPILTQKTDGFQSYAKDNEFQYEEKITPFWKEKSNRPQELTSLYGAKPESGDSKSTRINFDLGKERTEQLNQLVQEEGIKAWTKELALSNIFLTALATLVYKIGDKDEFTIGVPFHNRTSEKERKTVGLFMELLPVHTEVDKKETLIGLLQKIRNESLDVIKNTMVGKPPIDLLKSFNVVMNFTQTKFNDFAGMPMKCQWLLSGHVDPNHQIRLQIHDFNNSGSYQLLFDFNNNLFSEERMKRVGQHFIQVLDAFIEDKDQTIKELSIITKAETLKINEWNNTTVDYGSGETLLSKFEEQILKNPNDSALLFDGKSMTYGELHEKSNQVAHFLIRNGVLKNDIIAVSLERSLEMMVYIYGILKAGAAYLPIAISTPSARLKFILENAEAKILFFNHDNIKEHTVESTISYRLATIANKVFESNKSRPSIKVSPDDLAYVIYTSGSTGDPKGVKCHHRGICNRLNWMNDVYPISKKDTLLQKTPITFDVSVWELFWPLQMGARLVVEVPEGHKNPEGLIKTIVGNSVTVIHFVPSMLNVFIETEQVEKCRSLKRVFCSGEVLSVTSVEKVHRKLDAEVFNLYGPTEASVDVSSWHCKKNQLQETIPIGYPVPNTRLYILDEGLNLAPIGARGELYISGSQVALGYLNDKDLTAERFVNDIFSDTEGAIMYRTGDLARYVNDGAISYLGRADTQIKLRGQRIELREIEKTIEKHSHITQAVVKVDKGEKGQEYLVAYYSGEPVEYNDIVVLLEGSLPTYMVPSFFRHLRQFEFLSSGKIDRKKLPILSIDKAQETKSYTPPTDEFEEIIASTWKEILRLEKVGVDENFIQLGGNSLNAMAITSRLKTAFELNLPITSVFSYPTIKTYAAYIKNMIIELLEA